MKTKTGNAEPAPGNGFQRFIPLALWKNKALFLFVFLLLSAGAFAAGGNKEDNLVWKLDATVNGVQFYHAISDCNGNKVAFLKFVNRNAYAVNVSWKEAVKTQIRTETSVFRGTQKLTLPPGETVANNCSGTTCKACVLLTDQVNPTYPAQILSFSFTDISVIK